MGCKKARKLLGEYLDRRLEGGLSARLEAHLRACPACAGELEALRITLQRVGSLTSAPLPEGFVEKVSTAVRQRAAVQPRPNRWQTLRWLAPAFGVLIIGMITWWQVVQPAGYRAKRAMAEREWAEFERAGPAAEPPVRHYKGRALMREEMKAAAKESPAETGKPRVGAEGAAPRTAAAPQFRPKQESEPLAVSREAPGSAASGGVEGERVARAPAASGLGYAPPERSDEVAMKAEGGRPGAPGYPATGGALTEKGAALDLARRSAAVRVRAAKGPEGRPVIFFRAEASQPMGLFALRVSPQRAGKEQQWVVDLSRSRSLELPPFFPPAGASVWRVSLIEKSGSALPGRTGPRHEDYRLFLPSRLLPPDETLASAEYRGASSAQALADLSEKSGLVLLAPVSQESVTISLNRVPADAAISALASFLGCQVEADGFARNLIAE